MLRKVQKEIPPALLATEQAGYRCKDTFTRM